MPDTTITEDFFALGDDGAKPGRQELPRAELLARVSSLMQSCEGCGNVRVTGVMALDRPDEKGCNWGFTLWLDAAGVAPEVYGLAYAQVIAMARESWNLQPEPEPAPAPEPAAVPAPAPAAPMRIWVDGEACPAAARYVLFRAAERRKMQLTFVASKLPRVPKSPYLSALQVPPCSYAADNPIAREVASGDLVVTADPALAAAVTAKGARTIGPGEPRKTDRKGFAEQLDRLLGKI